MKKMFCLLIAFVMIFVICSCNDTLPSNDSNTYSSTKSSENARARRIDPLIYTLVSNLNSVE